MTWLNMPLALIQRVPNEIPAEPSRTWVGARPFARPALP
jgi:hypothetical protein